MNFDVLSGMKLTITYKWTRKLEAEWRELARLEAMKTITPEQQARLERLSEARDLRSPRNKVVERYEESTTAEVVSSAPSDCSGEADPLIMELRRIEAKPMCDEARLLMRLAIEAQKTGKLPDLSPLLPNRK